jgi:hypothetical protein
MTFIIQYILFRPFQRQNYILRAFSYMFIQMHSAQWMCPMCTVHTQILNLLFTVIFFHGSGFIFRANPNKNFTLLNFIFVLNFLKNIDELGKKIKIIFY